MTARVMSVTVARQGSGQIGTGVQPPPPPPKIQVQVDASARREQAAADAANAAVERTAKALDKSARDIPADVRAQVLEQVRTEVRDALENGGQPQIVIPNDFTNAVPRGAVTISTAFFVTVAAIAIFTPLVRAIVRRSDARIQSGGDAARFIQPQIEQLQTSIDAMAVELERVSEAQRFQSKLLAERDTGPARALREE